MSKVRLVASAEQKALSGVWNLQRMPAGAIVHMPRFENVTLRGNLIWADKFALAVGIVLAALFIFFWLLVFVIVGSLGAYHLFANLGPKSLAVLLIIPAGLSSILRSTGFAIMLGRHCLSELAKHQGSVSASNLLHQWTSMGGSIYPVLTVPTHLSQSMPREQRF
jgi:hypothetical protein